MIYIDSATLSLNGGAKPVEVYVPLWFADGTSAQTAVTTAYLSDLQDGSTTLINTNTNALFTLSTAFPAGTKFALEVTISNASASGISYAGLRVNGGAGVSASQASTSSTTMTVVRSGQFTLTSGTKYNVSLWASSASYPANITDASLIIFP